MDAEEKPAVPATTAIEERWIANAKDLAEHIRTVHFTLLVLCLVLFAIAWRQLPNEEKALKDAESLSKLFADYDIYSKVQARLAVASKQFYFRNSKRADCLGNARVSWDDDFPPNDYETIRLVPTRCWVYAEESPSLGLPGALNLPYQLSTFISFWNNNIKSKIYVPDMNGGASWALSMIDKNNRSHRATLEYLLGPEEKQVSPTTEISVDPVWTKEGKILLSNHFGWSPGTTPVARDGRAFTIDITARPEELGVNLQGVISAMANRDWPRDIFGRSFPELAALTKAFTDAPMTDLAQKIRLNSAQVKLESAEQEKIEVFGVKLSTNVLRTVGIVILVGCQFYLWLHIEELQRILRKVPSDAWIVGWIGLYPTTTARVFATASAALLPLCVTIVVILSGWPDNSASIRAAQLICGACCIGMAALLASSLTRMWKGVGSPSGAPPLLIG